MLPYLGLVTLIFFAGLVSREMAFRNSGNSKLTIGAICCALGTMAAIRAPWVGADTSNYQSFFVWISSVPLGDLAEVDTVRWNSQGTELTFKIFNKIVSLVSNNPQAITIALGIVLGLALYVVVTRLSDDPWLSLLLFVCLGLFQTAMNIAPSALAGLCCLAGFSHIENRKLGRFLLYVALGCVFHYSAILFVPLYFLYLLKWRMRVAVVALVVAFIGIPIVYPLIVTALQAVVPTRWSQYLTVERINLSQLLVWVTILVLYCAARFHEEKASSHVNDSMQNMMLLVVGLFYALTMCSTSFSRLAVLFAPYFIIAIPDVLSRTKESMLNKRTKGMVSASLKYIHANHAKTLVVILACAAYIVRLSINNIGLTVPYETFL